MPEYGYLEHHGILGQKWGHRNGPPYPLSGGDYTKTELEKLYKMRSLKSNSIYNKKHFDNVIKANKTVMTTITHDPNRMKNTDMFYTATNKLDKHEYNAVFNKKAPREIYDKNGKYIGTGMFLKYRIDQVSKKDIKVASEDSAEKVFLKLYKEDRDFYNFVTQRMKSLYPENKYKFKGYREAFNAIDKVNTGSKITDKDVKTMHRLFNYIIPNDGGGNAKIAKDVLNQRTKYFNELKKNGYGAVLDTNDAIYGAFKAKSPVIVFDMQNILLKNIKQTTELDKNFSKLVIAGRKALGNIA